jgi:hypothetical protein
MTQLTRRTPRVCVTLLLVLSLLGLGAADAAICWGADGHFALETRFDSCCRSEAPEALSAAPVVAAGPTALDPASAGAACEDTPLILGAPLARAHDVSADYLGQSTTVLYSIDASPAHRGAAQLFDAGSSLVRIRTVTLLI